MLGRIVSLCKENVRVIVIAVCAAIFLVLLGEVLEGEIMRLDVVAQRLLVDTLRAPGLTPVMESISALATPAVLVALLLVVVAFAPGRRPGACAAVNLVAAFVLNQVLKMLIQRPRPEGFRLAEASGFSFPSGHSMVAMAFFGLLIWMIWRYERDRAVRLGCVAVFSLMVLAIGVSRVYLGVHYASDVIAGFCAGMVWLALYTHLVAPLFLDDAGGSGPGDGGDGDGAGTMGETATPKR